MTMRASLIITAKDQASGPFARIAASARKMGDAFRPVEQQARAADRQIGKVGNGAWSRFARVGSSVRRMASEMRLAERAAYGLGAAIGTTIRKTASFAFSAAKWGVVGIAGGAAAFFTSLITGAIETGAKFEQFETILRTVMGSSKAAREAMAWVQKFAVATPFELEEVMAAFVKLRTYGIDGTDGSMRVLGDTASAMGKSLNDAVEAMADAMTGEFERLKEFGISASQDGDKVTLKWVKNGREMTRTVKKTSAEIKSALTDILNGNFKGAGAAQADTFAGMIANLKDQWSGFQKMVADAGIFNLVKAKLQSVLSFLTAAAQDGRMKKWAENISSWMEKAVNWASQLTEKDWQKFGADLAKIGGAVWTTAKGFAWLVDKLVIAAPYLERLSKLSTITIGGPVGMGWTAYNLMAGGEKASNSPAPKGAGSGPLRPGAGPARVPGWEDRRWDNPVQPGRRLPAGSSPRASAADLKVGGKVQIEVSAAPGTQVRTRALSSNNRDVPISVRTGKTMAGGV